MSRTQSSPRPFGLTALVSPQVIAISAAVVTAGCSANTTRFDSPMFGLTETSARHSSAPTPRVGMNGGMALGDAGQSYGDTYTPPSPTYSNNSYGSNSYGGNSYRGNSYAGSDSVTVASLPDPEPRPSYSSQGGVTGYQGSQYQQSYQPPSQQSYQPSQAYAPTSVPPAYQQNSAPQASFGSGNDYGSRSASSGRSPSRSSGSSANHDNTVEVQRGDTLYTIAQRNGVSISELMSLNSLSSPTLQPGQRLMLPSAPSATAAAVRGRPQARTQTARAPERAAEETYATPTPLPQPGSSESYTAVQPTQHAAAEPAHEAAGEDHSGETYTLKRGDNLYGIAVRHRVSVAELQRINGITDPRRMKPGMVLKIPGSGSASTAVAEAPAAPVAPRQTRVAETARPAIPVAVPVSAGATEASQRPVIINAQQPQQVAALGPSGHTATDAAPMSSEAVAAIASPDPAPAQKTPALERSSEPTAQGKFRWPVQGRIIAGFGKAADGTQSDGIKLAVPMGTDVHAAEGGVVAYAGSELKGYGNLVLVRHDNGWITAYAHNEELSVKRGDRVRRGQVIAKAGKSGNADSPQVHFELRQGSSPVDPIPHLEKL